MIFQSKSKAKSKIKDFLFVWVLQIDDGVVFNVAGGLLIEHPLTRTFVDRVVSLMSFNSWFATLFFVDNHRYAVLRK